MRLSLLRLWAFAYRQGILVRRNVFSMMEMLFWPTVGMLSIGLMGDFLALGGDTRSFLLTGAIAMGAMQVCQLDVAYALLQDVWSKSVKHTFLTPARIWECVTGPWIIGILRGTAVFFLLSGISALFFGFRFPDAGRVAALLGGLFANALVVGGFVSILILLFGQKAEGTAWALVYVIILFAGMYYPVNQLPRPFYILSLFIPVTYFLEYFRAAYGVSAGIHAPLGKGILLTLVQLGAVWAGLEAALAHARRKGTLIRLSE